MRIVRERKLTSCVSTFVTTATTRPWQSNTGAPEAPWSITRRSIPSYSSSRAVPADRGSSPYWTKRPPATRDRSLGYATLITCSSGMSGAVRIRRASARGNGVISSSTAIFSAWSPASRRMRTGIEVFVSAPRISTALHCCCERSMASATCAAVATRRGDRNQPEPPMPMVPGVALRSSSVNSVVMLSVERASIAGSRHAPSVRAHAKTRSSAPSNHRQLTLSPNRVPMMPLHSD